MNNLITKYNQNKLIISFVDLSSNKYLNYPTNQLMTLIICQTIKNIQFKILTLYSIKQKKINLYISINFCELFN